MMVTYIKPIKLEAVYTEIEFQRLTSPKLSVDQDNLILSTVLLI